jgi:hypothetical protein
MFLLRFSKSINRYLINVFDQSRLRYMFLLFPAYQFVALIGLGAIVFSFEAAETSLFFALLGLFLAILIGIPIFASWHLSCLLFSVGYFGFFASLGFPLTAWATTQLEGAVNWFRPV